MIDPNMIIVKMDTVLVSFELKADELLYPGRAFESDYIIEDYEIIFALFDNDDGSSKELYRFTCLNNSTKEKENIKVLYENGNLSNFVSYIVNNELGNL